MDLKTDRSSIVVLSRDAAINAMRDYLRNHDIFDHHNKEFMLMELVANAVASAVQEVLHNLYTQEDFEKDLTLR